MTVQPSKIFKSHPKTEGNAISDMHRKGGSLNVRRRNVRDHTQLMPPSGWLVA